MLAPIRRALVVVVAAMLAPGCDASRPPSGSPDAAAAASVAPPVTASATAEAMPAPDDLDVQSLKQSLKCATDPKPGPCGVLGAFGTCTAWSGSVPSGDGRWLGRGYLVADGKTTEQITIVRAHTVPTSEVGPGQLPIKVGIAEITSAEGAVFDQADRAIRAYERRDVPAKSNPTIEYLKKRTDWPEASATRTKSRQIYVISEGGAFLCQGARQQLLLVQRTGKAGEGLYAELWPATW